MKTTTLLTIILVLFGAMALQAQETSTKITFADGTYEGGTANGKPHGKGKYTYNNGNVYEGEFENGQWNGKAKMTWKNGDVYEGDFVNGHRTGKGKYTWKEGAVYEGDWVNSKMTGKGKFTYANGSTYEGDFADGKMTGNGKRTYISGKDLIPFFRQGDWGYQTPNYKTVIAPRYAQAGKFYNGVACVQANGKSILIDTTGKEILTTEDRLEYRSGVLITQKGKRYKITNLKGKELISSKYEEYKFVTDSLIAFKKKGKKLSYDAGIMDLTGKEVLPVGKYSEVLPLTDKLMLVWSNDFGQKKGIIDTKLNEIAPTKYHYIQAYSPHILFLSEDGKKDVYVDASTLKPLDFDRITDDSEWGVFSEGLAVAVKDRKYGYIDPTGKVVVPFQFSYAKGFYNGKAQVNDDYFIDKTGSPVGGIPTFKYLPDNERYAAIRQRQKDKLPVMGEDEKWADDQRRAFNLKKNLADGKSRVGKTYVNKSTKKFYTAISSDVKNGALWVTLQGTDTKTIDVLWSFLDVDYRAPIHVTCPVCKGYGTTSSQSEHITDHTYSQGIIIKETTTTTSKCTRCNGKGYVLE